MGRTKGGLNTKITALVDGRGRALQLTIAPGNMADVKAAETIVIPSDKRVVADKGYDSDGFRQEIAKSGGKLPAARREHPKCASANPQRKLNVIWLKNYRNAETARSAWVK